jgi:hypothetical protein
VGHTLRRPSLVIVAFFAVSCSGDSSGVPLLDPGDASYSHPFDPPRVVDSTASCTRLMTYAILSLGRRFHEFALSINFIDNCSRSGGGYTYWESYIDGDYADGDYTPTSRDFVLIPDTTKMPRFSATFDGTYVRFILPANPDSLAPTPVEMELGPRQPF